jgi:tetratricopeptide (TPR) repeat protein
MQTLHQRAKSVSSAAKHFACNFVIALVTLPALVIALPALAAQSAAKDPTTASPAELFRRGEIALRAGSLEQAELDFRSVLAADPQAVGAYANLGVISMRRKQWKPALEMLQHAEKLAPQVAGIRLNIGLVHYRQNDFQAAIAPFESVLNDSPDSAQARYLLGLCYFFTERYVDAATILDPLWPRQSGNLSFLYVLGISANKAKRPELEDRALGRLVEIGQNSAEFHLLMGKALINRTEYESAIKELKLAAQADPRLPFVHFNLGFAYLKHQDLENAKSEFLKDLGIEPDLADDYTELGVIAAAQQHDEGAAKKFREALRFNPQDANARYQLAKVFQRQKKYEAALAELNAALKLAPQSQSIHYVRGQVLQRLGRAREAQTEMATAGKISSQGRVQQEKVFEEGPMPNPELRQEPQ